MLKNRIYELDALRGIASLMVVIFHYTSDRGEDKWSFNIGCIGVDLFFIISGFVISLTIENNTNWKAFLLNRFSRLYPSYWVCVSLTSLFFFLSNYFHVINSSKTIFLPMYFANLTMIQPYLNYATIDGVYWTLIVELLFYVFILLLLISNKIKWIELFGGFFLIIVFCYRFYIDDILTMKKIFEFTSYIPLLIYFPLFYSGIIFYKIKFNKQTLLRWALLIISFALQLYAFNRLYNNKSYLSFTQYAIGLAFLYSTFVLYIFQKLKFIVNKLTMWLGSISYVLYLLHKEIGATLMIPVLTLQFKINFWIALCITLCIMLIISHLIMKYIEKTSLSFIRKIYSNKTQTISI